MATATTIIPVDHHFRVDAMNEASITQNQAVNYCVLTLDIRHPTPEQIENATSTLENMRQKIIKMGEGELKSLFVTRAAARGIKLKGNVVSNWNDLRGAWNSHVSLRLCKDIYEIMICFFITDGDWMPNKAREIKERLGIVIDSNSPTSSTDDCFVVEILKKKCFNLTWKTFGAKRKKGGHGVGLTQRKIVKGHPMGDVTKDCKTNKFFFQNVQNWEDLCAEDPMARMIQDEKDRLPTGDMSRFPCYQDVAWMLKRHEKRLAEGESPACKELAAGRPKKAIEAASPACKSSSAPPAEGSSDDDSQVPNEYGVLSQKSNAWQRSSFFGPKVRTVEKATCPRQAPDSIVTTRQHERSPAAITMSTHRPKSPQRKGLSVSAKDATDDLDIINGTSKMLEMQIDGGVFQTEDYGEMSTMRPSFRTEVSHSLFLQVAIVPVSHY